MTTELSVVIPAHNSGELVEGTLERVATRLEGQSAEIIVVENGSTDGTFRRCVAIQRSWPYKTISLAILRSQKGMGNALRRGLVASQGGAVLLTADDLPFGFDDLDAADRIAKELGHFPELLIGSKAHAESQVRRGLLRGVLTWGFAVLRRMILGMRTRDPQGTILINGDLAHRLVECTREQGFLFSTELLLLAEQLGIQPVEVPVQLTTDHAAHRSRVSLRDIADMTVGLFRLRARIGRVHTATESGEIHRLRRSLRADVLRIAAGFAISGLFLMLTLTRTSVADVWATLTTLSGPLLTLTLAACLGEVGVRALRWTYLLGRPTRVSIAASYLYICVGHFANALLPFRLGDAARAYLAGGRFGIDRLTVFGTIIAERLADGLLLLGVVTIGTVAGTNLSAGPVLLATVTVATTVVVATKFRWPLFGKLGLANPGVSRYLGRVGLAFQPLRSPRTVAITAALTAGSFAMSMLILFLALGAAGTSLVWWQLAVSIGAMTLSTAIPAAPGALGTYEFVGMSVLSAFGVPPHLGLAAVVAVHALATLPPALVGLIATLVLHIDVLGIRRRGDATPGLRIEAA